MNSARIIFCPKNLQDSPKDISAIVDALQQINLIDNAFENNKYYTGKDFLSLLTFLGCSPNINLSPDDGDHYCYIEFSQIKHHPEILGYTTSVSPRCPNCKHKIKTWQNINNWQLANTKLVCEACDHSYAISDLKWRQEGGYGLFSISIMNIHPHEAVPSDKLLQTLQNATNFEWNYFYANNE